MNTENTETNLSEISALSASVVQTWTHTTRADWEAGTLDWLDSATISGSLQLAQRLFGENTTVTPRSDLASGQSSPAIAVDGGGNAYAVWTNYRNGDWDIYFAYRPAGGAWGANVEADDDPGTASRGSPAIAVDGSGNAYAVWGDGRNGNFDIYFAYRPAGGVWGANVRVDDDPGTAWQSSPAIAVDGSGNAYAVWYDYRNGNSDIYFAYRPAGGAWGANVRVDDAPGTASQYSPAIAVDGSGNAYAVWTDYRNGDSSDVYFAYRPAGGAWGANVEINDDPGTARQYYPAIAVDGSGNAYAVWTDMRDGNEDIYVAYRPAAGAWGANVRVDDDPGTAAQFYPAIAVDGSGNAYAVWTDYRNGDPDIYFAYLPASGSWGANVEVNDDPGTAWRYSFPAIAVDGSGNAYAVWPDERNGDQDIYSAYRPAGGSWGANVEVNDPGTASQHLPAIAVDGSGNAYAVWRDRRNGDQDIYFAYRPAAGSWGANVEVNDNPGTAAWWSDPAIAVDGSGNAYAVWEDERNGDDDIYFAYRPAGGSWGANVEVNDGPGWAWQSSPAIAVDGSGNAYAVWGDDRGGYYYDIYFAYRPAGGAWGANVEVNDDPGTTWTRHGYPAIAVDGSGNAYAVWEDERNGNYDIYFAYRPAGGSWGANVEVNDDPGTAAQWGPAIAVDGSGNAYAVWEDERNGDRDIYFAYRPAGGAWGANVEVNDDPGTASQRYPAIAVDGSGNAYAVWEDERNGGRDIYFAYRPAGGAWGANVEVNDDPGTAAWWSDPAIAVDGSGNAYAVWGDYRNYARNIYFARSLPAPEYRPEGTYTSPELDTGVTVAAWESLTWQSTTPASTALSFETRSRVASGNWSEWEPVSSPVASPPGQYLQYRVTFSTTLTDTSPLLEQVQVVYRSAGTPSAPRFATPCGLTNQLTPTLRGSATEDATVHLYVDGSEALTTTASGGAFTFAPGLSAGSHTITATAENDSGAGAASVPLALSADPSLAYDPIAVRAGQWSKDGWLMSVPRDANGCADPTNNWRVWPRADQKFRVQVPVSYTTSAAVTVTIGTQTITLTEESAGLFARVFQPPIQPGDFVIEVNTDGDLTTVTGGPVLIDPDGFVYEVGGTISDTIPGVQVTCYYSDTHSSQWVMWDAWNYDSQVNPQITLDDGYYSFYTPPGTYRVVAEKEGYPAHTSPDLVVVDRPVRHNVPLGYRRVYLPVVLRNH